MEYDSLDEFCKYYLPGASLCKIDIWEIVQQNRYLGSSAVEQCFTVHCSVVLYKIYLEIIYWFPSTQPIEGWAPQKLLMQCDELGWIREVYFRKTFCYCNKANYQNNYKKMVRTSVLLFKVICFLVIYIVLVVSFIHAHQVTVNE